MSTRSTIFLTKDNEHCFDDCRAEHDKFGNVIEYFIDLEVSQKNGEIVYNDEESFCVRIYPDTDLHANITRAKENRTVFILQHEDGRIIALLNNEEDAFTILARKNIFTLNIEEVSLLKKKYSCTNSKGDTETIYLIQDYTEAL